MKIIEIIMRVTKLFSFGRFRSKGLIGNRTRHTSYPLRLLINIDCISYCISVSITLVAITSVFYLVVFLSLSLLIMGRTRRCTGCKTPLSDHPFGKPGKGCPGPEQKDDVSVFEEDNAPPLQHRPVDYASKDSIEATLASLVGAVKTLTTDLKEVQADNQQLRALLTNQSANKEVPAPSTSAGGAMASGVTLPELRAMQDLSQQADRRVAQLGLGDSSESDSDHDDVEASAHVRAKENSSSNGGGKSLKSGKESKITTTVLYPQLWPHSFLSLTNARRDIKYDELTLEEFVAGYGQILQSPDIVEIERSARLHHLVSLMYFAQQYEWQAVLSFHGAVLLEIERGLLKWGDSLFHLESRTLYGHPKAPKSSTSGGSSTPSTTVLYCRDFQRQQCSFNQAHYGYLRGERKWLRHICSD